MSHYLNEFDPPAQLPILLLQTALLPVRQPLRQRLPGAQVVDLDVIRVRNLHLSTTLTPIIVIQIGDSSFHLNFPMQTSKPIFNLPRGKATCPNQTCTMTHFNNLSFPTISTCPFGQVNSNINLSRSKICHGGVITHCLQRQIPRIILPSYYCWLV